MKQEIKAIEEAMTQSDEDFLAQYGGFAAAGRRSAELQRLPEARVTEGVSIDGYSTWRADLDCPGLSQGYVRMGRID